MEYGGSGSMTKVIVILTTAWMLLGFGQAFSQEPYSEEYYEYLRQVEALIDTVQVISIEDLVNRLREDVTDVDVSCLRMVPNYLVFKDYGPGKYNAIKVRFGLLYILVFMLDDWHSAQECSVFEGSEGEQMGGVVIDTKFKPIAIGLWQLEPHPFMDLVQAVYSIGDDGTTRRESKEYLFSDEIFKKE